MGGFCGYMKGKIVIGILFPMFRAYTNVKETCPITLPLATLKIKNLTANAFAPSFMVLSGRHRL